MTTEKPKWREYKDKDEERRRRLAHIAQYKYERFILGTVGLAALFVAIASVIYVIIIVCTNS